MTATALDLAGRYIIYCDRAPGQGLTAVVALTWGPDAWPARAKGTSRCDHLDAAVGFGGA